MVELSLTGTGQNTRNYGQVFEQLRLTVSTFVRCEISRRCLLAELEGLTDEALQDIGLDQTGLRRMREKPLFDNSNIPLV